MYKAKKNIMWYNTWYNEGDTITDEALVQYGLQEGIVIKANGEHNKPDHSKYDLDGDGDFDKDDVSLAGETLNKAKSLKKSSTKKKKKKSKKKAKK